MGVIEAEIRYNYMSGWAHTLPLNVHHRPWLWPQLATCIVTALDLASPHHLHAPVGNHTNWHLK